MCPHCGKPQTIHVPSMITNPDVPKKETRKALTGFLILGILFVGLYLWSGGIPTSIRQNFNRILPQQIQSPVQNQSGHQVPLQEVKNLGYDFYVGEIDTPGTTNLTDDIKNQITKIAYNGHFPSSLLKTIPIIILNNLALTGDQYISVPAGNLKVPDLKPDFLSEGGIYVTFTNGPSVIFINKPIIAQGQFTEVMAHELGHAIGSKLTDQDLIKFYQLRGIPTGADRHGTNWNLSPEEDFAEVYKNVYTGIDIRTYFGELIPHMGINYADMGSCMLTYMNAESAYTPKADPTNPSAWLNPPKVDYTMVATKANADPKVQACRKDVMLNQSSHASDWAYGIPYKSIANQTTKDFISSIVERINK